MVIRYFYDLMSQPSRAVYIFLKINKIPFEPKAVALRKGEHYSDEYKKVNPFSLVPVLDDNGFILTESVAILKYLVAKYNLPEHWYPRTNLQAQARVDEYMNWQHWNTRLKSAYLFRNLALDKVPGKPYRVKVVDTIHDLDVTKNKDTITNITSFYNFRFENSHLRMWQAYNIGEGKLVTLKLSKNSVQLKVLNDWTEMSLNHLITEGTEQASKQQKQTFICPMDGCIREFKNQISLDQHLLQGSCEYKLEKGPLKDQAKVLYAQKLSNNVQHCPDMQAASLQNAFIPGLSVKEMGWALKMRRKKIFFSVKQKEFMTDLFNQGEKSGSKIDPYTAAEHMRSGAYMFRKDEFLTAQQISGFFSRLAQQQRKTDKHDYKSAKSEIVRSQLKTEILETIED